MGNHPGGGGGGSGSGPDKMGMGRGGKNGPNGSGGGGATNGGGASAPSMGGGGGGPRINVYVGKLKPETDNSLVQELLTCCGRVEEWNRAVDPSTDLPKAFGFCTYHNAQAAAISVQLLNDLELAGQPILVKVGKKEQPSLEAFLSPKDEEYAKKHQVLLDAVKAKIDSVLVRYGERSAPGKGSSKGGNANSDGGKSPVSVGASSPSRSGRGSSKGGGKGDGGKGGWC